MKQRLVYIDQLVGPNSVDIVNALCEHYDVELYYGSAIITYAPFDNRIKLHKRNSYSKDNFVSRLLSWMVFYVTIVPVLLRKKHHVFLVSNPPLNFFVGFLISKLSHVKFSLLMWDIYPDIIIQSGVISSKNPIAKLWTFLNQACLPSAHKIFTVSSFLASEISKYEKNKGNNIRVVPTWTDAEKIKPMGKAENAFLKAHNLLGKFVVMYSGNMGKTHDLETLVKVAEYMRGQTDIVFVFVGDGEKRQKIQTMVAEAQLSNVLMLPFQDSEMFPHSVASADIGIVTLAAGFENYSVPSKTYYLMAAGVPIFVIAHGNNQLEILINDYKCGYRFDPGNIDELAGKLQELQANPEKMEELKVNARCAAMDFTIKNATIIANEVASV